MHAYTRDIGHYIGRTLALSMLEEGAYNRLISEHYSTEQALPAERKILYRIARAMSQVERKAVDYVLGKFFTLTEEGYVESGVMHDLAQYREEQIKTSRSAEMRRNKRLASREQGSEASCKTDATAYANADANPDANAMQNGCKPPCKSDAHQTPITNHHKPVNPTPNPSPETRQAGAPPDGSGVGGVRLEKGKSWPEAGDVPPIAGTPWPGLWEPWRGDASH